MGLCKRCFNKPDLLERERLMRSLRNGEGLDSYKCIKREYRKVKCGTCIVFKVKKHLGLDESDIGLFVKKYMNEIYDEGGNVGCLK